MFEFIDQRKKEVKETLGHKFEIKLLNDAPASDFQPNICERKNFVKEIMKTNEPVHSNYFLPIYFIIEFIHLSTL